MASKKHFSRIVAIVLSLLLLFTTTVTSKRHLLTSPNANGQRSGTQEALDDPWEPGSHGVWGGGGGWGGGRSQNHTPQRKAKVKT
ncbi:hypothetical protein E6C27_scaffold231G00360 [Cucumis melo var. makuwa]|uniref:Uncharacterized protein n=1 Tax=Cucumis melo var. makuwa TaxID=1194695 RepID=A0A5A7UIN4_CUCMM|nr:hypothetical protein E6C27_scaffold231G00360 [Cucumis melo var. makuwa]